MLDTLKDDLKEIKSTLAKLLASENINVVHDSSYETAAFDVNTRTLHCPIWEEMEGDLYDLFMGHEVGHALFTPAEGWHDAIIAEQDKSFKTFLNVVEDVRIEKLIKRKFPGLKKPFFNAYRALHFDRNFFGVNKLKDLSCLNLIDRINLYTKVGFELFVPFSPVEKQFLDRAEALETWEEVVILAKEIYEYVKENEQDKLSKKDLDSLMFTLEQSEGDDDEGDFDIGESDEADFDEKEEGEDSEEKEGAGKVQKPSDKKDDNSDADQEKPEKDTGKKKGISEKPKGDDKSKNVESVTDMNFRENERYATASNTGTIFATIPKPKMELIVQSIDKTLEIFSGFYLTQTKHATNNIIESNIKRFKSRNDGYIASMVREFEMKKNATEYLRAEVSKTGILDCDKLFKYRISNDLFKKVMTIPKGKSHGMVIFLDMSGSMLSSFARSVEQLLCLSIFCKRVNIPFDVYGFSNAGVNDKSKTAQSRFFDGQNCKMNDDRIVLKHLISSSSPIEKYKQCFNMLMVISQTFCSQTRHMYEKYGFGLNSTPTVQMLLASREILDAFKAKYKVDIVNCVHITDGFGDSTNLVFLAKASIVKKNYKKVYFTDYKTKKRFSISHTDDMQTKITEIVESLTGCKHIGIFLTDKVRYNMIREVALEGVENVTPDYVNRRFDKNGYFLVPKRGYQKYFFVDVGKGTSFDEDLPGSMRGLKKHFVEKQQDKNKKRAVANVLAAELAQF